MAHWVPIEKVLEHLPVQSQSLYPVHDFPIEVRYYLRDWIQIQRWEVFALEKVELECQAQALLNHILNSLQDLSRRTDNMVDRMKLKQISKNMANHNPLQFAVMVKDILMQEKALVEGHMNNKSPQYQTFLQSDPNSEDVGKLKKKVKELQEIRKNMHHMQEELNWERQNCESMQMSFQTNGGEYSKAELKKLMNNIQKLEQSVNDEAVKGFQLLGECVDLLDHSQAQFISRLKSWIWGQHKAAIGHPFDHNLSPLQTWCEHLLGVNWDLRQELMLIGEPLPDLQERLGNLLKVLIESSFVVEKQPPQIIKTQSKFSTTVRHLLGDKLAPGKPTVLKAQIVNEQQARNLGSVSSGENVGDVINNSAILEHNTTAKNTCANFRNTSIKKIKRADRKGSESVTEEKFALLFATEINITGCDASFKIQPFVVTVHGSQDNNASATIIWDCAFAEPDRRPFVVPENVPWGMMSNVLNIKFTSELQTQHQLQHYNKHFLAEKIFDKSETSEGFDNWKVSWAQFNKEVLPGRPFTFWQWFEGTMELARKHLKCYWSEGLIFGFIGKQHLHYILKDSPDGTFLLRFSDSEIGGITIAYVGALEGGGRQVQNIQPFTKRDLEIRSLGDRIRDIKDIIYLYPNFPKDEVFKKFYSGPQSNASSGYIPVSLQTKVGMESTLPATSMTHQSSSASTGLTVDPLSQGNMPSMEGDVSMDSSLPATNMAHQPSNRFTGASTLPATSMTHQSSSASTGYTGDPLLQGNIHSMKGVVSMDSSIPTTNMAHQSSNRFIGASTHPATSMTHQSSSASTGYTGDPLSQGNMPSMESDVTMTNYRDSSIPATNMAHQSSNHFIGGNIASPDLTDLDLEDMEDITMSTFPPPFHSLGLSNDTEPPANSPIYSVVSPAGMQSPSMNYGLYDDLIDPSFFRNALSSREGSVELVPNSSSHGVRGGEGLN